MTPATKSERQAAFLREKIAAYEAGQRQPTVVGGLVVIVLLLPFILLVPGVETATRMSFHHTLVADTSAALAMSATTATYYLFGFDSRIYRAFEKLETCTIQFAIGLIIGMSADASSFYWFFYLVHLLMLSTNPNPTWFDGLPLVLTPLILAVWFGLTMDEPTGALFSVSAGVTGLIFYSYGAGLQKRNITQAFEHHELEEEVAAFKLAAERIRIARDLHDGLTADLTAMAWRAEELAGRDELASEDVRELGDRARAAIHDTRAVVWALEGKDMPWHRLCEQIATRCEQLCGNEVQVKLEREGDQPDDVDGALALDIMRMVQESVRNAVQHASATHITVKLRSDEGAIEIMVEDDGVGMTPAASSNRSGLVNLRARVGARQGEIQITERSPGTRVNIQLPSG